MFHILCGHTETRNFLIRETEAVAYLIDLMHDKNPQVQKVCDATLDIIAQIDEQWSERVQREKFQFHNTQWLEIIQSQEPQNHVCVKFSASGELVNDRSRVAAFRDDGL